MANFSVKAYLQDDDKSVEVRRFAMSKSESKNFTLLCSKLMLVYGSRLPEIGEFAVFWKDDEGDEIRASSDEELAYALHSVRDDVLKIYIRRLKTNFSGSNGKCHHPGIVCDCCNKQIFGYRYKCMQCPNFDLCSTCEYSGNHGDHTMLRMPSPMKPGFRFHGGFRPHRFYGHNWYQQTAGAEGGEPKRHQNDGRRARFGSEPFHPYNFLNKMWSVLGVPLPTQTGQSPTTNLQPDENGQSDSANSNQTESNAHKPSEEEYLRNIGETVAAALDPLGIDVIVDVETRDVYRKENGFSVKEENQEKNCQKNTQHDAETGVCHGSSVDDENIENLPAAKVNSMVTNDWTYINREAEEVDLSSGMDAIPEMLLGIHLQDENPTLQPHDPNDLIANAVDTMMAMGFSNENGWLSALLELNRGSIEHVLDLLTSLGQTDGLSKEFTETFLALMERHNQDAAQVIAIMQNMRK